MARVLIVGGGCRGLGLARELIARGDAVRITTRSESRRAEIEATGAESWIGSPDRLGTLRGALESVTLACWLLGAASGPQEQRCDLHGSRLRSFVEHSIDTTVRGFVYEAAGGAVSAEEFYAAEGVVREVAARNAIPVEILRADPAAEGEWLAQARAAVASLLG